jgi:hypothetical protein
MHHPRLLLVVAALAACDAAIVANAQGTAQDAPADAPAAVVSADPAASKPDAPASAVAVSASIEPESLDLESINFLVKKGKVKNAAELEKKINDPKEKLSNVDVDGDGKVDKIQVVEIKKDNGASVFELRAIPSKTKDKSDAVVVAFINFVPDKATGKLVVTATYAPVVIGHETIVYTHDVPIEFKNDDTIVVVGAHPFYAWYFTVARPVYVGVFVYEVAPPPVIIIHEGKHWHHKHKHKGKWKGKGKWH